MLADMTDTETIETAAETDVRAADYVRTRTAGLRARLAALTSQEEVAGMTDEAAFDRLAELSGGYPLPLAVCEHGKIKCERSCDCEDPARQPLDVFESLRLMASEGKSLRFCATLAGVPMFLLDREIRDETAWVLRTAAAL